MFVFSWSSIFSRASISMHIIFLRLCLDLESSMAICRKRFFSFSAAAEPSFKSETSSSEMLILSLATMTVHETVASWLSLTNLKPAITTLSRIHDTISLPRDGTAFTISSTSPLASTCLTNSYHLTCIKACVSNEPLTLSENRSKKWSLQRFTKPRNGPLASSTSTFAAVLELKKKLKFALASLNILSTTVSSGSAFPVRLIDFIFALESFLTDSASCRHFFQMNLYSIFGLKCICASDWSANKPQLVS